MSNGAGAFLQGLAGGVGMGLQAKKMNTPQQPKDNIQAAQSTEQNWSNNAFTTGGLPSYGQQPGAAQQPAAGEPSVWQNILGLIGGSK